MRKLIFYVIAFILGSYSQSRSQQADSDNLIISKAVNPSFKERMHMSHRSHASHYSNAFVSVERDSLAPMTKNQMKLCSQNIATNDEQMKVLTSYVAKRMHIREFLNEKIKNSILLPDNELCFCITFEMCYKGEVYGKYTYIIPSNAKSDFFYEITYTESRQKVEKIRKKSWMYDLPKQQ